MDQVEEGNVLVTEMTDPDWVPVMKRASAIVTDRGGKTSHAAIVSRELGIPAIVRTGTATDALSNGDAVTVDCSTDTGRVYEGELEYEIHEEAVDDLPETDTDVNLILGDPGRAFALATLPVDGVGLAREEFIVTSHVGYHPLELLERGEEERFIDALGRESRRSAPRSTRTMSSSGSATSRPTSIAISRVAGSTNPRRPTRCSAGVAPLGTTTRSSGRRFGSSVRRFAKSGRWWDWTT